MRRGVIYIGALNGDVSDNDRSPPICYLYGKFCKVVNRKCKF